MTVFYNLFLGSNIYGDGCWFSAAIIFEDHFISFLPRSAALSLSFISLVLIDANYREQKSFDLSSSLIFLRFSYR